MHAVVVRVSISDVEAAQKGLEETVVPRISQSPGFVAAYWTRPRTEAMDFPCSCSNPRTRRERWQNEYPPAFPTE